LATTNAPSRSTVPNRSRAYHGNAAEDGEQREIEGTHDVSVAARRIVKKTFNAKKDRKGDIYERLWQSREKKRKKPEGYTEDY